MIRQYDHEVQGGSVVKPLVGVRQRRPGRRGGARLRFQTDFGHRGGADETGVRGVALACGINPQLRRPRPVRDGVGRHRRGGAQPASPSAPTPTASRCSTTSAGATRTCPTGWAAWCVRAGLLRRARSPTATPFISGKDSLNNEYLGNDGTQACHSRHAADLGARHRARRGRNGHDGPEGGGQPALRAGRNGDELGGSAFIGRAGLTGGSRPGRSEPRRNCSALHRAMRQGLVRACHDCSEGGLAVAAAEMALAGGLGLELRLGDVPQAEGLSDAALAFSESLGRFVVEVTEADASRFEAAWPACPAESPGAFREDDRVALWGRDGQPLIEATLAGVEHAWRGHLS